MAHPELGGSLGPSLSGLLGASNTKLDPLEVIEERRDNEEALNELVTEGNQDAESRPLQDHNDKEVRETQDELTETQREDIEHIIIQHDDASLDVKEVESQDENQTPSIATHKIISNRIDGVDNLERRNEEETMIELNDMLGVPSDDSWARDIVVADVDGDDRPGFLIGHDGRLNPLLLKVGDGTFKGSCEEDRDTEIEEQLNIDDEEVPVGVIHEARVDTDYTRIDSEDISNDFVTKDSQVEKSHPSQKIGGTKFESNDEDRENTSARRSSSTIMDKETHDSIDEEILSSTSLADDVVAESNDNDDEKTETMQLRMFSKVSRSESDMSLAEVLGDADNKYEEESPDSLEKKKL